MLSTTSLRSKFSLTKNLISDQTFVDIREIYTTASGTFDVSNGYGVGSGTSSVGFIVLAGGFADQKMTATMRAVATGDRLGVMARVTQSDSGTEYYYYANVDNGVAKLQKAVNGTISNISTQSFVFATGTDITIELTCQGADISAVFTSSGVSGSPLTLSGSEDVSVPRRGCLGWRTHVKPGWCRSFTAEEL